MNRIKNISISYLKFGISLLIPFFLNSCEFAEEPYLQDSGIKIDTTIKKKVFIEDYTAFKCGSCPKAHEALHSLISDYPENIVAIAVHASLLSTPDKKHTYDFRTKIGTEWDIFFGISNAGLPKGMVDRNGYNESANILSYDAWEAELISALEEQPIVSIDLSAELINGISIKIDVGYSYKEGISEYHNLNVVITEDSIVQYQRWYGHEPQDIDDYVHNHVLRAAVNGDWGNKLIEQEAVKTYTFPIPEGSDWRPENLNVIAFISDVGYSYEVFQVEKIQVW